jgi:hypothetical protein
VVTGCVQVGEVIVIGACGGQIGTGGLYAVGGADDRDTRILEVCGKGRSLSCGRV